MKYKTNGTFINCCKNLQKYDHLETYLNVDANIDTNNVIKALQSISNETTFFNDTTKTLPNKNLHLQQKIN